MNIKLLTEHHLEFLSCKGGCTGSSESTLPNATLLEITCHGSILSIVRHCVTQFSNIDMKLLNEVFLVIILYGNLFDNLKPINCVGMF